MFREYTITYKTTNVYEHWADGAHWQFLIEPIDNETQNIIHSSFTNSLNIKPQYSTNGYGFKNFRISAKEQFKEISFEASFKLKKLVINVFNFIDDLDLEKTQMTLQSLSFKVTHEPFLKKTPLTTLPNNTDLASAFDASLSLFKNLQRLNTWVSKFITFETGVTEVDTTLEDIIKNRKGVCQDYTHLFCALAIQHSIPARYVTGYIHQDGGYLGDAQMHAWTEVFIPNMGWLGFDATNNILVDENHIKVAHGKDYTDCLL